MRINRCIWAGGLMTLLGIGGGCIPVNLLSPDGLLAGLSSLVLEPDETCAELRVRFGVEHLPLVANPADAGLDYEEHALPVTSETALRVWYLPARLDRGTVIYSCGNSGEMTCYLFAADLLTSMGWSVVMYDYEGFGGSGGEPSLGSLTRDLEAVLDWTLIRASQEDVSLMGISLGTIPSIALGVKRPDGVNAVILDSPIAMMAQIERYGWLVLGQTQQVADQLGPDLLSDALIAGLSQPLLIFAHERDPIATLPTVERLFAAAPGPKQIVRFPELGHAVGQFARTDSYLYYLEAFLGEVWTDEPAEAAAVLQPRQP